MKNTKSILLVAFVIFILFFSVLTVIYWSFMTDKILIPIYYLIWVFRLILNSVPQGVYLVFLVVLGIIIALKTLGSLRSARYRPYMSEQPSPTTRYRHWRVLCAYASGTWFSRSQLAFESRKLILSILAFEQGIEAAEAEVMVWNGELDLPDTLREVIVSKSIPDEPSSRFSGILFRLRSSVLWRKSDPDPYMDQFLTEFINFVEHHLEITSHARNEFES